jgi:hypothetical protein
MTRTAPGMDTQLLQLCALWVDAAKEVWSLKLVTNSCLNAGTFLDKVYKLMPMRVRMRRSMESLNHNFADNSKLEDTGIPMA